MIYRDASKARIHEAYLFSKPRNPKTPNQVNKETNPIVSVKGIKIDNAISSAPHRFRPQGTQGRIQEGILGGALFLFFKKRALKMVLKW